MLWTVYRNVAFLQIGQLGCRSILAVETAEDTFERTDALHGHRSLSRDPTRQIPKLDRSEKLQTLP